MSSWNEYTITCARAESNLWATEVWHSELSHYIKTIAEVILLCAKQELALRGHKESSKSLTRGNFLEILSLVAHHDPIIKEKLQEGAQNAKYTSPEIQNSLLEVLGGITWDTICNFI